MAKTPSIAETVERLLHEVNGTAAPTAPAKTAASHADPQNPLKKLAAALRTAPEPQLTYAVLHVVKTAMVNNEIGPLPLPELRPEGNDPRGANLRKLANHLRVDSVRDNERLLAKGAHVLRASRGLMLLRELVRE
jgi:hypothetical protein